MVAHARDDGLGSGSNGGERVNGSEKKNRQISEANSSDNKEPSPVWVFCCFLWRWWVPMQVQGIHSPAFSLIHQRALICPPQLTQMSSFPHTLPCTALVTCPDSHSTLILGQKKALPLPLVVSGVYLHFQILSFYMQIPVLGSIELQNWESLNHHTHFIKYVLNV